MNRLELYVFTYDFPFKGNDSKFIGDEIDFLSKKFKKINLIPLKVKNNKARIKKNVFIDLDLNKEIFNLYNLIIKIFNIAICKFFWKEILSIKSSNILQKIRIIIVERYLAESIIFYIKKKNLKNNLAFYSIWSNHSLLAFYLLKKKSYNQKYIY